MRWLRAPLVHFLAGGSALFVLVHGPTLGAAPPPPAPPVVLSAADVAQLRDGYARESGLPVTEAAEAALVDAAIDEELLVREARRRGLDRHDRSIRNWLVEQMRALGGDGAAGADALYARAQELGLDRSDLVVRRILVHKMRLLAAREDETPPDDATLRAFFAAHRDDYRTPPRYGFTHVFFSASRRGARAGADAAALAAALARVPEPAAEAARRGDPFVTPGAVAGWSPAQVERLFGGEIAAALAAAPERSWIGPLPSPYGMHVVWLEAREPGAVPPFEAVRGRVRERWLEGARSARVAALLRALRTTATLRIESAAWRARRCA